jgi:hypothetical protein
LTRWLVWAVPVLIIALIILQIFTLQAVLNLQNFMPDPPDCNAARPCHVYVDRLPDK